MRTMIFILAIATALPVFGQRRTKSEEGVVPLVQEGIIYALPRTGLKIYVTAVKETFEPGPYAAYAEQLLGITGAKTRSSVVWSIDEVEMETFAEPDPEHVYKTLGDAAFVGLTPDGILTGINTTVAESETVRLKTNRLTVEKDREDGFSFANITDRPFIAPGDSSNNFRPTRVGVDRKAAEAAERILECRQSRYYMVAGLMDEFHPDGDAYEASLEELEHIEKEYMSLFTGRTTYQKEKFSFDFVPTSAAERGEVAFRFSEETGVVPASDLSAKPVTVRVEPEKGLVSKFSGLAGSDNPTAGESGVYYRTPAVVHISLNYEVNVIATARLVMAQFGRVAAVPEELLNNGYGIEFHPETGAIKSIQKK